jgi:hypothetical protein
MTFGASLVRGRAALAKSPDGNPLSADPALLATATFAGPGEAMIASVEADFDSRQMRVYVAPASAGAITRATRPDALGGLRRALLDFSVDEPLRLHVKASVARDGKVEDSNLALTLGPESRSADGPLVSCLMVTRDRAAQASFAIEAYRRQTWPHRELVVLDTSLDDDLARLIATLDDPSIRHIHLPDCADRLGLLRNRSVAAARGMYVTQWDDDDLSHVARLEIQLAIVQATGTRANVLMREMLWMPSARRLAILRVRPHENTLLCERATMPSYDDIGQGEDTRVLMKIAAAAPVSYADLPELYLYVVHGTNTWDDQHMERIWRSATATFVDDRCDMALLELMRCYPLERYRAWLEENPPAPVGNPAPTPDSFASPVAPEVTG